MESRVGDFGEGGCGVACLVGAAVDEECFHGVSFRGLVRVVGVEVDGERSPREEGSELGGERVAEGGAVAVICLGLSMGIPSMGAPLSQEGVDNCANQSTRLSIKQSCYHFFLRAPRGFSRPGPPLPRNRRRGGPPSSTCADSPRTAESRGNAGVRPSAPRPRPGS